jgi:hypothetical protein
VLRIGLDVVMGWYREQALAHGVEDPPTGSVTVVQRFGGALNLNVHFHTLNSYVGSRLHVERRQGPMQWLYRPVARPGQGHGQVRLGAG